MPSKFLSIVRASVSWLAIVVLLGATLAVVESQVTAPAAQAAPCPAGTTTRTIGWGSAAGVVWADALQNTGHSITYSGVGGGPVDMTMSVDDPHNMNEDADNPLLNLPTGDGNWDPPFFTQTDGLFGTGFLMLVMTSLNSDQVVTFSLEFSSPIILGDFSIGDIDYSGNNVVGNDQPHDSFQDEILMSAQRGESRWP